MDLVLNNFQMSYNTIASKRQLMNFILKGKISEIKDLIENKYDEKQENTDFFKMYFD